MVPGSQADHDEMRRLNRLYNASTDARERARFMIALPPASRALLAKYFAIRANPSRERVRFEKENPELQRWGLIR